MVADQISTPILYMPVRYMLVKRVSVLVLLTGTGNVTLYEMRTFLKFTLHCFQWDVSSNGH